MESIRKVLLGILITYSTVLGADIITGHSEIKSLLKQAKSKGAEAYTAPINIVGPDNQVQEAVMMLVRKPGIGIEWQAVYLAGGNGPNVLMLTVPDGVWDKKLKDFLNGK